MKGALVLLAVLLVAPVAARPAWTSAQATAWSAKQPWLIGANYIPSIAVNQLEMWQAETFDPATIDRELGWAEGLGMNSMRVFLHDLPWQQDAPLALVCISLSRECLAAERAAIVKLRKQNAQLCIKVNGALDEHTAMVCKAG